MYYYFLTCYMFYKIYRNFFIVEQVYFWSIKLFWLSKYIYKNYCFTETKDIETDWVLISCFY